MQIFVAVTLLLAVIRLVFPSVAKPSGKTGSSSKVVSAKTDTVKHDTVPITVEKSSRFFSKDGSVVKNRIYSVPNFGDAFPDQNDVQLTAAENNGVQPVADQEAAAASKSSLVYIGSNPYFYVDRLRSSIPYLVPKASILLQDIGRSFFDSLQIKGIPLHKIIVTSVLRSKADVEHLRSHNSNATQNSCHMYGTTFDICYNRYKTVEPPDGPARRQVRNDTLKWVLAEVLNDMRKQNRCYIKYEVKQGCFHITVR